MSQLSNPRASQTIPLVVSGASVAPGEDFPPPLRELCGILTLTMCLLAFRLTPLSVRRREASAGWGVQLLYLASTISVKGWFFRICMRNCMHMHR